MPANGTVRHSWRCPVAFAQVLKIPKVEKIMLERKI
jgi:hypothetical protein